MTTVSRRTLLAFGLAAVASGPVRAAAGGLPLPPVIDASVDTTSALPALKAAGVRAVMRYYASERQDNLPEKRITRAEADAIRAAGLSIGIAYQYFNNRFESMTAARGRADAAYALAYARDAIGQPAGSAIYFGVDGDWPAPRQIDAVLAYFDAAATVMSRAGGPYRIGVYGSGRSCEALSARGLAERFWLARSTGWTGTPAFYNGGGWSLYQTMHEVARGGIRLDTNVVNPTVVDQGLFDAAGPVTAFADKPSLAARRFVKPKGGTIYAAPARSAAVVDVLKARSCVAVLSEADGWASVDSAETGRAAGYMETAGLSYMHEMPA